MDFTSFYRNDNNEPAAPPKSQPRQAVSHRWVISSKQEMASAAPKIAAVAERNISIFTQDLEPGIYDSSEFLDVVKHLILAKNYVRVRVLIADPSRAIKNGNRLVHLGRRLNTYIEFRHVHEDHKGQTDTYCIADDKAIVYRTHADRWEGIADTHEPRIARMHLDNFDVIWQASAVENEFRRLHL